MTREGIEQHMKTTKMAKKKGTHPEPFLYKHKAET